MAKKNGFISWVDGLPRIVKIIFALPILDIIWGVYRLIKAVITRRGFIMACRFNFYYCI